MKIGINLFQMWSGKMGGMEQFLRNLIEYTSCLTNDEIYLFLNKYSYDDFQINNQQVKKISIKLDKNPQNVDAEFHKWINDLNIHLWFCPLFTLVPKNLKIPSVVMIPDIQHEFFPEFFQNEDLHWRKDSIKYAAASANIILTISHFSKATIIDRYKIPEDKIITIHGDAPTEFISDNNERTKNKIKQKYQLPDRYGLYPANTWPHKNHINLLKSLVILRDKYDVEMQLIFTGYKRAHIKSYNRIQRFIMKEKLNSQVKILGYVPQEDMPYLYLNAGFLVYPSLFEGFGIPLVEAMKTNIPIICSDAGSIPEVVGDSALIFNPHDPEDIAIQMLEVLKPEIRKSLVEKGKIQSENFSWKKSAKETLVLFHRLVDNGK